MTESSIVLSNVFQAAEDLIALPNGNFIARYGHIIQVYSNTGTAVGSSYAIVSDPNFNGRCNISALDNGGFVATWYEFGQASTPVLKARVFDSLYQPVGSEIIVSSTNSAWDTNPIVIGLTGGQTLIIWDDAQGTTGGVLRGQFVNSLGVLQGTAFTIESSTAYVPAIPAVTKLSSGNLFLTWTDNYDTANAQTSNIWARQLDANGQPTGSSFIVNSASNGVRLNAKVTAIEPNKIVVTWSESSAETGSPISFFGQIVDTTGGNNEKVGVEFNFGEFPAGWVGTLDITLLQDGYFMVVWEQHSDVVSADGNTTLTQTAIKAQIFDADGRAVGEEISVATGYDNSDVPNGGYEYVSVPQIVNLGNGNVLVSWGRMLDTNASDANAPVSSNPGKIYNFAIPTATGEAASEVSGTSIALADLFTWNDGNGLADVISFSIADLTAGGGYLTHNGIQVTNPLDAVNIPIADIANWAFVSGPLGSVDTLQFTVTDAAGLSNRTPVSATVTTISTAPTASAQTLSAVAGTITPLANLFSWNDADGAADIVSFSVADLTAGGGYLTHNGIQVTNPLDAVNIPIADIANWAFVSGPLGSVDTLQLTVTDAAGLSNTTPVSATVTTISTAPTASAQTLSAVAGTITPLANLFSWNDADGAADIVSFSVADLTAGGGYLTHNGIQVTNPLNAVNIPIADIANWAFVSGPLGTVDTLQFTVTDTAGLSNTTPVSTTITTINSAPTVTAADHSATAGSSTPLANLFTWNDADGSNDIITFSVSDLTAGGGYLTHNGIVVTDPLTATNVSISDIANWAFVSGILGTADTLQFSVRDAAGASNSVAAQSKVSTLIPGESWTGSNTDNTHAGSALADLLNALGGDDTLVGNAGNDVIYGGSGNDRITGVNPGQAQPGSGEIDIMVGGAGSDIFVLGDLNWQGYDDQNASTVGSGDYALIADFTRGEDILQLQGDASQYLQQVSGNDIYIFINKPAGEPDELVAVVKNQGGLGALTAQSFRFIKDTDGDGVFDYQDNAILVANPDQRDTDGDGYGNVVDGDFNNDGRTNGQDLGIFASRFGTSNPDADLNGDGRINGTDLGIFANLLGKAPGLSYINLTPQAPAETTTPIALDLSFPANADIPPTVELIGVQPDLPLV